jgi:PAS domain S-box-containing protein
VKNVKDHAIFTLDLAGHITSWNLAAERILGYSEREALGQPFSIIFTPEDVEQRAPERELRLAKEKGRAEDERWHRRKNGEHFWALGIITPTHDARGQQTGFSKILRDMTERKRAEEALHESDRRKNEFLAMLAHELRNPLAPIFTAIQLIGQNGGDDAIQREARTIIERQVRHMARLIDDLLEVSRITSGRIQLHIKPTNINAVVELAVERTRPLIVQRKQKLSISLPDASLWLDADSARLEQVLGNLLHNASKYNNIGGRIWLSAQPEDDYVVIRVKDDGVGMPEHLLPRIFDLFTQADISLDRSEGGLGVGLALVKSLVEMHHGTVEAHSDGIGRGSEFVVRLPITLEQVAQQESASSQPAKTATVSRRVLVVDDSVDAAKTLAMLLRSWGHEVRIAHNGPDALQRAVGFQPHLILLDIGLPDMDGYEVARLIRQNDHLKGVHLVAVTGYGQDSDRQQSKDAGFDNHLLKPVEPADLRKLLDDKEE